MIKEYLAYLRDNPNGYWFKAKLYGWGWAPARREGWYVIAIYILVILAAALQYDPSIETTKFGSIVSVATALLITICHVK